MTGLEAHAVIPVPAEVYPEPGVVFELRPDAVIHAESEPVGAYLAARLRPPTGYELPLRDAPGSHGIELLRDGRMAAAEEYILQVEADRVTVRGRTDAGLFYGVQTLLQLLPPAVEAGTVQ